MSEMAVLSFSHSPYDYEFLLIISKMCIVFKAGFFSAFTKKLKAKKKLKLKENGSKTQGFFP